MKKLLSIIIINLLLSANPLISGYHLRDIEDIFTRKSPDEIDAADEAAQEKIQTTTENVNAKNKKFRKNQISATEQSYINKDVTQEEDNYLQILLNQLTKAKSDFESSQYLSHDITLLEINPKNKANMFQAARLRKAFKAKFKDTPEMYPQRALEQYSLLQRLYDEKKAAISNRPAKPDQLARPAPLIAGAPFVNQPIRPARPPRLGRLAPAGAPFANRPAMPPRVVPSTPISNRPTIPDPLLERRPFTVPAKDQSRTLD